METNYLKNIEEFIIKDVKTYLTTNMSENEYPSLLIDKMKNLGLFGISIPVEYQGKGFGVKETCEVITELSKGWLTLTALLGTHFRVAQYVLKCGTDEQKSNLLPLMARGKTIIAHGYHEQGIKKPSEFNTTVYKRNNKFFLKGEKHWVTNARNADFIAVIAKSEMEESRNKPMAVLIKPTHKGVSMGEELKRPGVKGVSLCSVQFNECEVNENDFIGGVNASIEDFINNYKSGSSIAFAARCVGASKAVVEDCKEYILTHKVRQTGNEVISFRFAQLAVLLRASESMLNETISKLEIYPNPVALGHMTKVFCSDTLQEIIKYSMMLKGGSGYASLDGRTELFYRDAASMVLIDTPNDILLSHIGKELLN